jgi:phosphoenolpyruvate carboxykinase (GTP)
MIDRIENHVRGQEHLFGLSPSYQEMNWSGLSFTEQQFNDVTHIDKNAWTAEIDLHKELFHQLAYHLPAQLKQAQSELESRLALI